MNKKKFIITIVPVIALMLSVWLLFSAIALLRAPAPLDKVQDNIQDKEFDAIILPGQGAMNGSLLPDDGERDIQSRIAFAAEQFLRQERKPLIILSGYGRGYRHRDPENQEAHVLYRALAPLLVEEGYNVDKYLLTENQSHHTIENAFFSRELLPPANPSVTTSVLVLAPAKSYRRTALVFTSLLDGEYKGEYEREYEVTVYSLRNQTEAERRAEWLRVTGTIAVLLLPGEKLQREAGEFLFRLLADESCREQGYLLHKAICNP